MVSEDIDPGWNHNPGIQSLLTSAGEKLRRSIDALCEHGPEGVAAAAKLVGLDDRITEGRAILGELLERAGEQDAKFPKRFRDELQEMLRQRTGPAVLVDARPQNSASEQAAKLVRDASFLLPAGWAEIANRGGAITVARIQGGEFDGYYDRRLRKIETNDDPGTALHELAHHIQAQTPALDALFRVLHHRRTSTEDPGFLIDRKELPYGEDVKGRKDNYVDSYFGREYDGLGPIEVMTMAMETLWFPIRRIDLLGDLIEGDPEMLHLTLGLMFQAKEVR